MEVSKRCFELNVKFIPDWDNIFIENEDILYSSDKEMHGLQINYFREDEQEEKYHEFMKICDDISDSIRNFML